MHSTLKCIKRNTHTSALVHYTSLSFVQYTEFNFCVANFNSTSFFCFHLCAFDKHTLIYTLIGDSVVSYIFFRLLLKHSVMHSKNQQLQKYTKKSDIFYYYHSPYHRWYLIFCCILVFNSKRPRALHIPTLYFLYLLVVGLHFISSIYSLCIKATAIMGDGGSFEYIAYMYYSY